jgi:hypothetical protein
MVGYMGWRDTRHIENNALCRLCYFATLPVLRCMHCGKFKAEEILRRLFSVT